MASKDQKGSVPNQLSNNLLNPTPFDDFMKEENSQASKSIQRTSLFSDSEMR